jgi:hypothetical protein
MAASRIAFTHAIIISSWARQRRVRPCGFGCRSMGSRPAHGVDAQGYGTVTGQRWYQLVRQTGPTADRQFAIDFLDPGAEVLLSRSADAAGGDLPRARILR